MVFPWMLVYTYIRQSALQDLKEVTSYEDE